MILEIHEKHLLATCHQYFQLTDPKNFLFYFFLKQCSALQKFTQRRIRYHFVIMHICGHIIWYDVHTLLQRRTVDLHPSVNELLVYDCQPHEDLIFCKHSHFLLVKNINNFKKFNSHPSR
jgi:hypothetical protein